MTNTKWEVGVACIDKYTQKNPFLMTDWVEAKTFEEAREIFLKDPTISRRKANDIVMVLGVSETLE